MAASRIAVDLRGVTYRYPGRGDSALDGVTVSIPSGTVCGVAGLTGSGKSSFVRVCSGLAPRVLGGELDGKATVAGIELPGRRADRLAERIGVVLDNPWAQLSGVKTTVYGELALPLENRAWPREAMIRRVGELLNQFDLQSLAQRSPLTLSGGELQRLVLASALAARPTILMLDEPEIHLDPEMARSFLAQLSDLAGRGTTVVLTTHASGEARERLEDLLVLGEGRVLSHGSATTLLSDPQIRRSLCLDAVAELRWKHLPTRPGPPVLRFDQVSFTYTNGPKAAREVSFTLHEGEAVALVGPNGAGKTTLARLALGLARPVNGAVFVGENNTRHRTPGELAAYVGVAFQNPDIQLLRNTVKEELEFGPRALGRSSSKAERAVERAADMLELSDILGANPHELAWSKRRLVSIACVVAMEPHVLILDEPTAGLDGRERACVTKLISDWVRDGDAVLAITHDIEWVCRSFHRVLGMRGGRVEALDALDPRAILETLFTTSTWNPGQTR